MQNVLKVGKQRVRDSERRINCEEYASARHPRHHMETNFLTGAKKPDLPVGNSMEHDLHDENCMEPEVHGRNIIKLDPLEFYSEDFIQSYEEEIHYQDFHSNGNLNQTEGNQETTKENEDSAEEGETEIEDDCRTSGNNFVGFRGSEEESDD